MENTSKAYALLFRFIILVGFCQFTEVGAQTNNINRIGYCMADNTTREFRGFFPIIHDWVRVQLTRTDTLMTGFITFEGYADSTKLIGTARTDAQLELREITADDKPSGANYDGTIDDGIFKFTYSYGTKILKLEFEEVDLSDPPDFKTEYVENRKIENPFSDYIKEFPEFFGPTEFKFNPKSRAILDYIGFMDKPVQRVGTYDAPFALSERRTLLKHLSSPGKIVFSDRLIGLIVQAYFDDWVDGSFYAMIIYIYNINGEFVSAFPVYEAPMIGFEQLKGNVSMTLIFTITNANETQVFSIDEDEGSFIFKDR